MQPMADAAGVKLLHDTTQVEITADPDRLLQVITNLLSNAVKFSPPNSPVSVMLRPGVTGVILSVIDHGRGIPADKLETIFGRFQQVDASDSRQKGGTGLGLAICRTIVLQHSGRIWAERNPVRGSTFRIFLPYHPVPVAAQGGTPETETGHGTVVLADANAETRPEDCRATGPPWLLRGADRHRRADAHGGAPGRPRHPCRYFAGRHERMGDSCPCCGAWIRPRARRWSC